MRQIIERVERHFHPQSGRFSSQAKKCAGLAAFALVTYFILIGVADSIIISSNCGTQQDEASDPLVLVVLVALLGLTIFPALRLRWERGRIRRRDPDAELPQLESSYLRALRRGGVGTVVAVAMLLGISAVDQEYRKSGPTTHNMTSSGVANRALDTWEIGQCVLYPTERCDVLFTYENLPLRTQLADRACRSGHDGTHPICTISLEVGSIPRGEICRRDAVAPFDERVCGDRERNNYRRSMGLMIHGER